MHKPPAYVTRRKAPDGKPQLISPRHLHPHLLSHIGDGNQEHAIMIAVDHAMCMIGHELVHKGVAHETPMAPRDIFRRALRLGANGVIIAHNHPTGPITPSGPDIECTRHMIAAGNMLEMPVLDHLIFNPDDVYSMKEHDREHGVWRSRLLGREFYGHPSDEDVRRASDEIIRQILGK